MEVFWTAIHGSRVKCDGLKPDPKKVEAITQIPRPQNTNDVQRFVGMVKYLTKFIPDLSNINAPIRQLTDSDTAFVWGDAQETAFDKVKELVANSPVLGYYDPSKPLEPQGDASERGLGFVLLQDGKPVSFTSRALSDAEERYSQIEKELFAQVFGLKRNNQITYGRHFILWTDHKPLVSISKKPLVRISHWSPFLRNLLSVLQSVCKIFFSAYSHMTVKWGTCQGKI